MDHRTVLERQLPRARDQRRQQQFARLLAGLGGGAGALQVTSAPGAGKAGIESAFARFPVEIAYLHGSVARGRPLPTSDVDLAVVLSEPLPAAVEQLKLEFEIQAAVEEASGLSGVDVRAINRAPLMVQGEIVQEGIRPYARDRDRCVAFEALTRRMYFDYRPTAERMERAFLEHLRQKGLGHG